MAWLARSIANSLNFDDDGDDAAKPESKQPENSESGGDEVSSPTTPSRGVKEDLSELSKTLTRQFWGVASFLAPAPPPQGEEKTDADLADSEQDPMLRIRDDFAEIGGKFKSGISRLSNNMNVSEITKLASNFLQLESDDEREKQDGIGSVGDGAVGVTEEVVAFARDVAMHPETWLDFPLPLDDEDDVDFDLSDAQQEHALAVERLAPRLAALRLELCPGYMTESCFWKIYFVLVHPRLDKTDAVLLSTPQIMEARALLAHELKKKNTTNTENLSVKNSSESDDKAVSHHEEPLLAPSPETGYEKASLPNIGTSTAPDTRTVTSPVERNQIQTVDKSVTEEKLGDQVKDHHSGSISLDVSGDKDEDDADDWLKEEETSGTSDAAVIKTIRIENEDDVSFSDLEDDDADVPTSYRKSNDSSDKDSRDWVRLGKSVSKDIDAKHNDKDKESNDWLDVDDIVVS